MNKPTIENHHHHPDTEDTMVVGRITGPWGLRGELKVESHTNDPNRFSIGNVLLLNGCPNTIKQSRSYKSGFVVKFDQISSRTQAESLRGTLITTPFKNANPLPNDSYYHYQIINMGVWTQDGRNLGNVREIIATGANDVYIVRDPNQKEVLIPAIKSIVLDVSLNENRMIVQLPKILN